MKHFLTKSKTKIALMAMAALAISRTVQAQNINTAIDGAKTSVSGITTNVGNLILAIGGVVGLVGGIRVFIKWQNGEENINKQLAGWIGACVFLVLSGTIVSAFFG